MFAVGGVNIVQKARRIARRCASHGECEDERDQEYSQRVVPVEELKAIVLYAFEGVSPGAPADGARDHHQQRNFQTVWGVHGFSLALALLPVFDSGNKKLQETVGVDLDT